MVKGGKKRWKKVKKNAEGNKKTPKRSKKMVQEC